MRVHMGKISQNSPTDRTLVPSTVYAELRDDWGGLLITATLEYVAQAIAARGWYLASVNGVVTEQRG